MRQRAQSEHAFDDDAAAAAGVLLPRLASLDVCFARTQAQRLRRPVLQRAAARSVRAAARRAERRERRLRHHQGSRGRRADAAGAHPDPLHGRRGQVLVGRSRRGGARRCRRGPTGCSRSWRASRSRASRRATRSTAPASRSRSAPAAAASFGQRRARTGSGGTTGAGGAAGGGVMVSFQGAVGPFDAAVVKSDRSRPR